MTSGVWLTSLCIGRFLIQVQSYSTAISFCYIWKRYLFIVVYHSELIASLIELIVSNSLDWAQFGIKLGTKHVIDLKEWIKKWSHLSSYHVYSERSYWSLSEKDTGCWILSYHWQDVNPWEHRFLAFFWCHSSFIDISILDIKKKYLQSILTMPFSERTQ